MQPIQFHGSLTPDNMQENDLEDLLSDLEFDEEEEVQQYDTNDVSRWFDQLSEHY